VQVSFSGRLVALLADWQKRSDLTDQAMAAVLRVSQPHWTRVRSGGANPGERVLSGAAVALPDLARQAIDEVQALKVTVPADGRAGVGAS
jgi:hypothetical protein